MSAARYNMETTPWSDLYFPNQRYVDFNFLARNLWCNGCNQALSLRNLVNDRFEESGLQLLCTWCESIIDVLLIAPASAQFHEKHSVNIPRKGRSYSKKVVSQEGENEKPPESAVLPHCKLIQAKLKDKGTKETQQEFICSKTAEPNINIVNALKRPSSQKLSNSRPILKRNLQSNISDYSRQETELSDGNSGDGQDFGFDFQEDPFVEDEIDFENSSDIALAGSGDTEEYEIPDWAVKPICNSSNFECGYCYQCFDSQETRLMHFKDHSNFNNLMCWCGRKFPSRTVFRNHRTWHGRGNQCHICGKMLHVCKQNFSDHLNICGDLGLVNPLQCELCPKIFKTDQSFKSHARVHAIRTLECAHCSKKFHTKPQLLEHMALHTKKFPYNCHLCRAKFTRLCNLKAHVNNNHRYMCFLCSKQFSSAELAKVHVQASHSQAEIAASGTQGGFMRITKFECTVCGRCLASKQTLLNHEKIHQKSGQASGDCGDDNAAAQATGELKDAS